MRFFTLQPDAAAGPPRPSLRRAIAAALLVGAIGTVSLAAGCLLDPSRGLYAYLAAFAFVSSIVLGALVLLATVHAMDAGWPVAVRRLIEAVVGVMPLLALLVVPILVGVKYLYPWMTPEAITDAHTRELVEHRLVYLNVPFFVGRAVGVLVIWVVVAGFLRWWSLRQDKGEGVELRQRMRVLGAASLPVLGITISFASFDWLMSLTPEWFTTMYGVYYFAGGFIGALALVALLMTAAERYAATPALRPAHYYALGRLMLAFTIFWAYIAYFQFFLTWIANRPVEATWYLDRMQGGWGGVSLALAIGQFVVPFFVLLPYAIKWRRIPLAATAAWILVAHYIDSYWLVLPARHGGVDVSWMDLSALLAVGGVTFAYGLWTASRHPLVVMGDPRLGEAFAYDSR